MISTKEITKKDFKIWLEFRNELWPDVSDEMHNHEMDIIVRNKETMAVFFAYNDELPIGFLEVSIRDRVDGSLSEKVGYLEGWYIKPEFRQKGIGKILVDSAEEWVKKKGLTEIGSDSEIDNEDSIDAHKALGFNETFRLVHFLKKLKIENK